MSNGGMRKALDRYAERVFLRGMIAGAVVTSFVCALWEVLG